MINRGNRGHGGLKSDENPFRVRIWKNVNSAQKLKPNVGLQTDFTRPQKTYIRVIFCFVSNVDMLFSVSDLNIWS